MTSLAAEGVAVTMAEAVDAVVTAARGVWGPIDDVAAVTDWARGGAPADPGSPTSGPGGSRSGSCGSLGTPVTLVATAGTALERRMVRAGVDPVAGVALATRKPEWLRVKATMADGYLGLQHDFRDLGLVTVCEEAGCPNIYECWSDGTATFMINGSRCTRACGFCKVDTRHPLPLDADEPARVAEAVARMGLAHAVITCVARDDLADGGAGAFAETIAACGRRARERPSRSSFRTARATAPRSRRSSRPGRMSSTTTSRRWPDCSGRFARQPVTPAASPCWPGRPPPGSPPNRASSSAWGSE